MKVKVLVVNTVNKVVTIDTAATVGAQIETDLRMPDGTLANAEKLRDYIGVSAAGDDGIRDHRLLRGLKLGDDHPQYTQWIHAETITGQWQFSTSVWGPDGTAGAPSFTNTGNTSTGLYFPATNQVGLSTNGVLRWDVSTTAVTQTVPLIINVDSGSGSVAAISITNTATGTGGGIELSTFNVDSPGDDTGNQIGLWEGPGRPPGSASAGFRWRHEGDLPGQGDMVFYSHVGSASGTEIYRHKRDAAQMLFVAGTDAAPTVAIRSLDLGMYSPSANALAFVTAGQQRGRFENTFFRVGVPIYCSDGTAGAPFYTWLNEPDCGMYLAGTNTVGWSTGGTLRLSLSTTIVTSTLPFRGPDGSGAAPTWSFSNSTGTGVYLSSTNDLALAAGGAGRLAVSTARVNITVPIQGVDGSATAPQYSFSAGTGLGMYRITTDQLGFATAGTLRLSVVSNTAIVSTLPWRGPNGGVGGPAYSYSGDTDTGDYLIAADQLGRAAGGVLQFECGTTYSDQKTQVRLTGVISPAQLTADTDNWNPTGLSTAAVIRASTDASRNLTGIQGGVSGRELRLINIGTQPLVLVHDATSTAANRFLLSSGTNQTLQPGGAIILWYDSASSRWRNLTIVA